MTEMKFKMRLRWRQDRNATSLPVAAQASIAALGVRMKMSAAVESVLMTAQSYDHDRRLFVLLY